ncbi:RagB/SusD family nutrient uptake outer membrane protein [Mucilaginibacter ginkgonis]|uniref:RagB/SusD family nutrient uptake outer membrane protein n=1 Tax=Mucilaginibacter ginkgonis TaxID=2682091 RepID=A0A6I4HVW6_9SPHI|nr:RagB/SusD family nutrient uptake outer membrane protein [Mucilaginibacter ginkgonis]QQL49892.1 RagB/SusD family nutrient uptake outer membrane protein [Mucilaginibacter ginkgonis]
MRQIEYKKGFCLILLIALLGSCKKFLAIDPPQTQAQSQEIFNSDQTATSAAVGVYYQMASGNLTFLNGAISVYPGLSADELTNPTSNSDYDPFKIDNLLATTSSVNSKFWSNGYKYIYNANAVIEGINNSTGMSATTMSELKAEMLFVRALNNFYLVNLFGDIPLITVTDYRVNSLTPRTPADQVYDAIISDLLTAKTLFNGVLPNTRPNKFAAAALLARVYLYRKDWVNAEKQATEVISSNAYLLESNLNNVFLNTSGETIFQLGRANSNTSEGFVFVTATTTTRPAFTLTAPLYAAFTAADKRRSSWIKSNVVGGVTYNYPYKYKVKSSTSVTESNIVLRLAEQYLIRAEARAQQGNLTGGQADLNNIRFRAGLTASAFATQTDLLAAVAAERRLELFAEWGHRWLDLKRTNMADAVLGSFKGTNWQTTDALYPIPQAQILLNPALTQNPSY